MKILIKQDVINKIPGIQVAVVIMKNIANQRTNSAVSALLRGVCAQKRTFLKNEQKSKEFNLHIGKTKYDNKVLPEVQLMESSCRKIVKGKDITPQDNLYNLIHYIGLKFMSPVFGRDLDQTEKDIEIDFITPKQGKRPEDIVMARDTKHVVLWYLDIGSLSKEEFAKTPMEAAAIIEKYCGGTDAEVHIIRADAPEFDLGYESEKEKVYRQQAFENAVKQKEHNATLTDENQITTEDILENPPFLQEQKVEISNEPGTKEILEAILYKATNKYLEESGRSTLEAEFIELETPADPLHGDYSGNVAMKLAKNLDQNPTDVASAIVANIENGEILEKTQIAGPGFINFFLSQNAREEALNKVITQRSNYGRIAIGSGKKVLIEYSSPNIAKPLGVHHLLSTIIGQTLANIYKYAGFETVTLNWPGDWGTQFGKLIYAYKTWGSEEQVKKDPLTELLNLYVKFHQEEENNPELVEKGREEFKKLEEGDDENNKIWEWFKQISVDELEKIYQKLGVHFDEYLGERMYLEASKRLIGEGRERNIVTEGEKGALMVNFENEKYPPYMLQKADGTTLYSSRDLASLKDRIERHHPDKVIYVVDVAQKLHLQQLFETSKKYGFGTSELIHVIFGRMQMPEGKMSTRKGEIILLEEVIKQATERTTTIINEKSHDLTEEEKTRVAEQMAISAVKYNIISQNRETNITFDWDKMLSLEGNSAPYLQYAFARASSIMRKSGTAEMSETIRMKNEKQTTLFSMTGAKQEEEEKDVLPYSLPKEQELLRLFPHFPQSIAAAVRENKPNLLTNYLYELARAFNSFYNDVPVLNASRPELLTARLRLVKATAQILQNGLSVLGISIFEKM